MSDPEGYQPDGVPSPLGGDGVDLQYDPFNASQANLVQKDGFDRNKEILDGATDAIVSQGTMEKIVKQNSLREAPEVIAKRAFDRVEEVVSERTFSNTGIMSRVDVWNRSNRRYMGDHWSTFAGTSNSSGPWVTQYNYEQAPLVSNGVYRPGVKLFTDNRTQNAIITAVQNQMSRPPVAKIEAQESSGKRKIFLKADAGFRLVDSGFDFMALGLVPDQVINPDPAMEDDGPVLPITERQFQRIMRTPELTQPSPVMSVDPATGMSAPSGQVNDALLTQEDFWFVDDDLSAKTAQKVFDTKTNEAMIEMAMNENVLYNSIYGHCPIMACWDEEGHRLKYSNLHVLQTFPDPTATTLKDMEYLIYDYVVSMDAAIARWPWAAKQIQEVSKPGQMTSSSDYRIGRVYYETDFKRQMLTIRTMWERHLPVPMTEDEALLAGLVVVQEGVSYIDSTGSRYEGEVVEHVDPGFDEMGNPIQIPAGLFAPDDVDRVNPLEMPEPFQRLILKETGKECWPERDNQQCSVNWPTIMGIRQTQILLADPTDTGQVLEISRCPYKDIPVGWNINIPEPWSPYGQGEPYRLEDVQQLLNRTWTIMYNHLRYYQYPMEIWPESLLNRMKKSGNSQWGMPGRCVGVPDQQWADLASRGIQTGFFAQPAPIPGWVVNLLQMTMDEHDRLSGNTAVLQGNMPSSGASGRTVESLTQNAKAVIAYKSMFSQWAFEHLAQISLDAIVKWMPESQWKAIFSGIPWPVLREVIKSIESTKWNIKISVYSGRGVVEEIKNQQAIEQYAGGAPTRVASRELTMERLGIPDPQRETKRIDEENQRFGLTPQVGQQMQQAVQDATIQAKGEELASKKAQNNSQPPSRTKNA